MALFTATLFIDPFLLQILFILDRCKLFLALFTGADEGTDAAGQQILDADPASRSISPAAERSNAVVDSKAVSKDMPPTTLV